MEKLPYISAWSHASSIYINIAGSEKPNTRINNQYSFYVVSSVYVQIL